MAQANIAEEMHARLTFAELRHQAPLCRDDELEGRPATLGEGGQHSLDSAEQAAVRYVQDHHQR